MPADMPVAELCQPIDKPRIVGPRTKRHAEPWTGVDAGLPYDGTLCTSNVRCEGTPPEHWHAGMVEGVVSDQVAVARHSPGHRGVGLGPAALNEEGRAHVRIGQVADHCGLVVATMRPIRVLGVEGKSDTEAGCYFSTPLMTIPRVKNRWKAMNRSTGTTRVINVPAWMSAGLR